jgi:NIPSNAP
MTMNSWKLEGWTVCVIPLVSFVAGSLIAARLMHVNQVRADSNPVFELRVYHAVPGRLPAMESRFRDTTSKLLVKHDLNVIGYWIPDSKSPAWDNTFVFLLAHSGREEAAKNWQEMAADPVFQEIIKSEQKERLLDKADTTYMRPTDFSPMK